MDTYALQRQLLQAELPPTEKLVGMVLAIHMDKRTRKNPRAARKPSRRSVACLREQCAGPLLRSYPPECRLRGNRTLLGFGCWFWKEYWKSGPATGVLSDRSRVSAIEAEKGPLGV